MDQVHISINTFDIAKWLRTAFPLSFFNAGRSLRLFKSHELRHMRCNRCITTMTPERPHKRTRQACEPCRHVLSSIAQSRAN